MHVYNPRTQEVQVEGSRVQGYIVRPYLTKKIK
jgi:hypothetical protein